MYGAEAESIPTLFLRDIQVEDDGFLWTKSLAIQSNHEDSPCTTSFEDEHKKLYNLVFQFQQMLYDLDDDRMIKSVKSILQNQGLCTKEVKKIFKNLEYKGKTIYEVLFMASKKLSKIVINNADLEALFKNPTVQSILKNSLKRLKYRNACMGSLASLPRPTAVFESPKTIPLYIPQDHEKKPVIFLSGMGNELILLLKLTLFKNFEFVIFYNGEARKNVIPFDNSKKNLEHFYINAAGEVPLENAPYEVTNHYKSKVLTLKGFCTIEESEESPANLLRQCVKTFQLLGKENLAEEESIGWLNDSISNFDTDKDGNEKPPTVTETKAIVQKLQDMVPKLGKAEKKQLEATRQSFIKKFCDSEQALRYFLLEHILHFLEKEPVDSQGLLVLNLHSIMDPCRRCTNALYLECLLNKKNEFIINNDPPEESSLGFFQKYFNRNSYTQENMPPTFILVSSQKCESEGGISRRLLAGRGKSLESKITSEISLENSPACLFFRYNGPYPYWTACDPLDMLKEDVQLSDTTPSTL